MRNAGAGGAGSSDPMGASITIRDVAEDLHISHTTVSRALADSPKISDETKRRVREAAERLGYVPSASARTMRGRPSNLVGLVIPDVQNDFYASVAKFIASALAPRSMHLMLSITDDDPVREYLELKSMRELRPAGLIVVPTAAPAPETAVLLRSVRTVQLLRRHEDLSGLSVLIDDYRGIYQATRHLQDYGHRRIAYIGGNANVSTGRARRQGFEDAMRERGDDPAAMVLGTPRPEFGRHAATTLLARPNRPTAFVLGGPELTLGTLQALRGLNLRWPDDVSVVGYHDPAWFELAEHGISTVRLPVGEVATTAASMIVQGAAASDGAALEQTEVILPPTLVLRGSTAPIKR